MAPSSTAAVKQRVIFLITILLSSCPLAENEYDSSLQKLARGRPNKDDGWNCLVNKLSWVDIESSMVVFISLIKKIHLLFLKKAVAMPNAEYSMLFDLLR